MESEQKIRTQRILGNLIKQGQEKGEVAAKNNHPGGNFSIKETNTEKGIKTLKEVGLTPHQSMDYQTLSDMPEEAFEKEICF